MAGYDKFRYPELYLSELLRASAKGRILHRDENPPVIYRALVVAVDVEGGRLENPDGSGDVDHAVDGVTTSFKARTGPKNPQNSVKARILTNGLDQFVKDEDLRVYWPIASEHFSSPVKPGEHVYVMFEDGDFLHGLWLNKVPGHENLNFVSGESTYKKEQNLFSLFEGSSSSDPDLTDKAASETTDSGRDLTELF